MTTTQEIQEAMTSAGSSDGAESRRVAETVRSVADTVAGVAGDVGSRLPDAASEATRLVRSGSDETLKLAGAVSIGLTLGLLIGGANRLLVLASLIPAGLIGSTLLERSEQASARRS
jgi:hypothetical protein